RSGDRAAGTATPRPRPSVRERREHQPRSWDRESAFAKANRRRKSLQREGLTALGARASLRSRARPGLVACLPVTPEDPMELREFFAEDAIRLNLEGTTKDEILKELISLLKLDEKSEGMLFKMLKRRENLGST